MANNKNEKVIRVALRNGDDTKVKVDFHGGIMSPEEFISLWMGVLETYTVGLLKTNTRKQVFDRFNMVFGIYLNKLVPEKDHYKYSKQHKEFKKTVDATLGRKETLEDKMDTEDNRMAAYILAADILTKEVGLTQEAADIILNKRLGLMQPDIPGKKDEKK